MAAVTSAAGPHIQPIFQPVVLNVLPPDEIVSVRSRMPGSVAIGTCVGAREHEVLVDLVGDDDEVVLDGERGDRRANSSRVNTLPVGLCGVLSRISFVRGVIAARSSSGSAVAASAPGRSSDRDGAAHRRGRCTPGSCRTSART